REEWREEVRDGHGGGDGAQPMAASKDRIRTGSARWRHLWVQIKPSAEMTQRTEQRRAWCTVISQLPANCSGKWRSGRISVGQLGRRIVSLYIGQWHLRETSFCLG